MARKNDSFGAEEGKLWRANVLSFDLQVERGRPMILCGGVCPSSDKEDKTQRLLIAMMRAQPKDARLMVHKDIKTDLDSPSWSRHEDGLADEAADCGLVCAIRYFSAGG